MKVTEVKVFPVEEEKLKAFVSIVFDDCFMVNDVKVIQGREGLFISMPSRRKKNGKFKDVAHPLNNDTRRMIEDEVLAHYAQATDGAAAPRAEARPQQQERTAEPAAVPEPTDGSPAKEREETPPPAAEQTLEEVTEKHLSDSFWTT